MVNLENELSGCTYFRCSNRLVYKVECLDAKYGYSGGLTAYSDMTYIHKLTSPSELISTFNQVGRLTVLHA